MMNRRDIGNTLRLGAILGLVFGAINLVFTWLDPLSDDSIGALLRFYGPMFGAWAYAAFRAARREGRVSRGVITAVVLAFATFVVFSLMNLLRVNVFLDDVTGRADWSRMTALFRASGYESLRAFVTVEYLKGLPLKVATASAIGAVMGLVGAALGRLSDPAR